MNFKLLITTYRNRFLFLEQKVKDNANNTTFNALNLGSGEGDCDPMIAKSVKKLVACDINERDVAFASSANAHIDNLSYEVENALELSFANENFDLIVSSEVIEHVGKPQQMMQEIHRVLKKDGVLIITYPSEKFPFTYDPINRILSWLKGKDTHIAQGAYAFGHEYLICPTTFEQWCEELNFEIVERHNLGGYLIGALEAYWTGWIQRIVKDNSANVNGASEKKMAIRPSQKVPALVALTDFIIKIDKTIFTSRTHSIGMGYVLKKK